MSFVYLAQPYAATPSKLAAIQRAQEICAAFFAEGTPIFSPIAMNGPVEQLLPFSLKLLKMGHSDWLDLDLAILKHAKLLVVACEEGWAVSRGVNREVGFAVGQGIPVRYLMPGAGLHKFARHCQEFLRAGPPTPKDDAHVTVEWTPEALAKARAESGIADSQSLLRGFMSCPEEQHARNEARESARQWGKIVADGIEIEQEGTVSAIEEAAYRKFATGATRNLDSDKVDYEGFLSPVALIEFGNYMHANRGMPDGSLRDSDNWQKGIPLDEYMKSMFRHFIQLWDEHRSVKAGMAPDLDTTRDALCALFFNVQGYLHELLLDREETAIQETDI